MIGKATKVLNKKEILSLMKKHYNPEFNPLCFYNSRFNGFITQKDLMVIPMFDKQVLRAHAVFDTSEVYNGKTYLLEDHMRRIETSCKLAEIPLPMKLEDMKERIIDAASFCISSKGVKDLSFRMYVSTGGLDPSIYPPSTPSVFYFFCMKKGKCHRIYNYLSTYIIVFEI